MKFASCQIGRPWPRRCADAEGSLSGKAAVLWTALLPNGAGKSVEVVHKDPHMARIPAELIKQIAL